MVSGNEIKEMYENRTGREGTGLFGSVSGVVKNLTIGGNVFGQYGQGGITSYSIGTIQNCHSKVNFQNQMSNDIEVGGIAGRNKGKIEYCSNYGIINVENTTWIYGGGIVGVNNEGEVTKSYNYGTIRTKGTRAYSGGIVGYNLGSINECYNLEKVEGNANKVYLGGIAGNNESGVAKIENCYNRGNIEILQGTAYGYAGGIAGANALTIANCYNCGQVYSTESDAEIGGLIGIVNGTVKNCYFLENCVSNGKAFGHVIGAINEKGTALTESEMKESNFIDMLNTNLENSKWTSDTKNINKGYPVLIWQK